MSVCTNILNILSDGKFEISVMEHKPDLKEKRISDERIRHMHTVAELMYQYHDAFQCKFLTKDEVYLLGLNHDIGYINGKDMHEYNGAHLISGTCEHGASCVLAKYIMYHGVTPAKYMQQYMCSENDIPKEQILLWWADMNVESGGVHAGEVVGFKGRLESLKERYGEDSEPYMICKETIEWLINFMSKDFLLRG